MDPFLRLTARLSTLSGIVAAGMIVAAVGTVCHMVATRYLFGHPTIWQTEFSSYLVIAAIFLGSPYGLLTYGHVYVDLVPRLVGPRLRLALALVSALLCLAVCGVLAWLSIALWLDAWHGGWRSETLWAVPLWQPYLAMPAGTLLMCLQLLADIAGLASGARRPFGLTDAEVAP